VFIFNLEFYSCSQTGTLPASRLTELSADSHPAFFSPRSSATCPGRWLATAELLIVTAHLIRNFDFGTDVTLHEKLPDEGDDTKFGAPCKAGTGEVVKLTDLDGKSYNIVMPNMENSGTLLETSVPPCKATADSLLSAQAVRFLRGFSLPSRRPSSS